MPDHETIFEVSRGQFWSALGGAGVIGAAIVKAVDKLWLRISARSDGLEKQLIVALKESAAAQRETAVAMVDLKATLGQKLDAIHRALPKRSDDKETI